MVNTYGRWTEEKDYSTYPKENMNFTEKEKQIIYVALMQYGNSLAEVSRQFQNEDEISEITASKAKKVWQLAKKIAESKEEV